MFNVVCGLIHVTWKWILSMTNLLILLCSGYTGTERDVLQHIAVVLGAVCQEYLVRKANAKKQLQANTHLIVNSNSGSKYEAAKKWNLPALSKRSCRLPPVDTLNKTHMSIHLFL